MSEVRAEDVEYIYGGEPGQVVPPEGIGEEFGERWEIKCFRLVGSLFWQVTRRTPTTLAQRDAGLCDRYWAPGAPGRVRAWLLEQERLGAEFERRL